MTLSQHVTTAQAYFIQYYVQVYYTQLKKYSQKNKDNQFPTQMSFCPRATQQGRVKCRCHVTVPMVTTQEAIPEEGKQ